MKTIPKLYEIIISFAKILFRQLVAVIYLFTLVNTNMFAQILPSENLGDWANAGVQGGIPNYTVAVNVNEKTIMQNLLLSKIPTKTENLIK